MHHCAECQQLAVIKTAYPKAWWILQRIIEDLHRDAIDQAAKTPRETPRTDERHTYSNE